MSWRARYYAAGKEREMSETVHTLPDARFDQAEF